MTTPQVIHLTHCVDMNLIARIFTKFRGRYGNLWISRATQDADWEFIMEDWHEELSKFSFDHVRAAVNKTLSIFKEYPPTLGQIIDLCMKESGVPDQKEAIRLMVARDFSHPIVKMVYEKIGSWTLTNGKEEDIQRKTKEYYTEALANFHIAPDLSWSELGAYNEKHKQLPAPEPKIASNEERKSFKERLAEYQKMADNSKTKLNDQKHPEFDKKLIDENSIYFDKAYYEQYKQYLLSIPETLVLSLPVIYAYHRMRFISAREQPALLRNAGYNPTPQGHNKEPLKGYCEPSKVYKNWTGD